ncbi:MAG: serine hydroxymethyltransferase, partial [Patescibacteria group bacterium]|nr:serine hydroxymethyltransferase [Patescibacteria group bacterium]
MLKNLKKSDPIIAKIIQNEIKRQQDGLVLIASENYASPAVLEALGSALTNKYSEGYPGKRYYGGNQFIDQTENLAIERAKKLFLPKNQWTNWQVNVQPYSGSPANLAVYFALLQPGALAKGNKASKIMGMSLAQGGHLTHGHPVNLSGKIFKIIPYGVDQKTNLLNYKEIEKIALKNKPQLIVCGATAYSREIDFNAFRKIADKVGAILMADISHIAGLIAAKKHLSPFPYCDVITTTTHKTLRGPRGAMIFAKNELAEPIQKMIFPGTQGGPHDNNVAGIAVALQEALKPSFKKYGAQICLNAKILAQTLKQNGLNIITGGTDNHLILVDVRNAELNGKEAEKLLEKVGIYVNRNTIPFDPNPPFKPSGLRLGTPALTTRGMKEKEMK